MILLDSEQTANYRPCSLPIMPLTTNIVIETFKKKKILFEGVSTLKDRIELNWMRSKCFPSASASTCLLAYQLKIFWTISIARGQSSHINSPCWLHSLLKKSLIAPIWNISIEEIWKEKEKMKKKKHAQFSVNSFISCAIH